LVVDDDPSINETLTELLEDEGHEIVSAIDGVQGLKCFNAESPDLVITDLIMPNEDGIGFLFKILGEHGGFPCKVIVISGGGRIAATHHLDMTIAMGVDAAIEKPFSREKLLKTIDEVIAN